MTRCRAGLTIQEMDCGLAIQVEDKRCRATAAQNISQRKKFAEENYIWKIFKVFSFPPSPFFTTLRFSYLIS